MIQEEILELSKEFGLDVTYVLAVVNSNPQDIRRELQRLDKPPANDTSIEWFDNSYEDD